MEPTLSSMGTGSDVRKRIAMVGGLVTSRKRIAAPMVGRLVTSFLLELLVYPAFCDLWRRRQLPPQV